MGKIINNIPIISVIFRILNAYVYKGNLIHLSETAPLRLWFDRIGKGVLFSVILGGLVYFLHDKDNYNPEDIILAIFPSILGFGIGVFALLFALPTEFLDKLRQSVKNSEGKSKIPGPEMLSSDMAFPLLIYSLIMLLSALLKALPASDCVNLIATTLLMYGFVVTFELLNSIFMTATYMLVVRDPKDVDK
ncbi:hypothetical protein [Aliivibrio wodanis]|uniref:hypothetical protein n=1 Tax=Aliivibrio wodanis TaxID=80852 RepID=UPI00406BFC8A